MATSGIGFRWLDILEKEFDKACVELDTSLVELEPEEPEVVIAARQKISTLSSCFAQLTHKALAIFQNSAKLEAELVDMRAELVQARAACPEVDKDSISESTRVRAEAAQLARENAALRETMLALHSELFGARLATKYLDKELAGRIQQLQLLGRDMRPEIRDSLWAQVEAEILLQRHKTLVRVCRGAPLQPRPAPPSRVRVVRVRREPHLGLGISVTGGREHGVPVLISELEAGGPAARCGQLHVGDAILAIDHHDLTQACHKEAVQALQSVKGDCELHVQFIATDDDDRLSEDNYRFPLFLEQCPRSPHPLATPTAPRTPDYTQRAESEVGSRSECESPHYAEVYRPQDAINYTEYNSINTSHNYNSINNNLTILDIDDETIKIETQTDYVSNDEVFKPKTPPESPVLTRERARNRQRGQYRGVPEFSSSNDSPQSTPVHGRRPGLKKKRVKPTDWKIKGSYKPVDDEGQSSDEIIESSPVNGHGISTVFDKSQQNPSPEKDSQDSSLQSPESADLSPAINETSVENQLVSLIPPPKEVILPPMHAKIQLPKTNGIVDKQKSKMFRIGLAKRITDAVHQNGSSSERKLSNQNTESKSSNETDTQQNSDSNTIPQKTEPSYVQTNKYSEIYVDKNNYSENKVLKVKDTKSFVDKVKYREMNMESVKHPSQLITGDGDPDFGTPV